jgi:hypothetical protein
MNHSSKSAHSMREPAPQMKRLDTGTADGSSHTGWEGLLPRSVMKAPGKSNIPDFPDFFLWVEC